MTLGRKQPTPFLVKAVKPPPPPAPPSKKVPMRSAIDRMETLGRSGVTVSVCCGPCGDSPFRWTVQVLSRDGQEFHRPFAADDFNHAIEIAELEIEKRGWAAICVKPVS